MTEELPLDLTRLRRIESAAAGAKATVFAHETIRDEVTRRLRAAELFRDEAQGSLVTEQRHAEREKRDVDPLFQRRLEQACDECDRERAAIASSTADQDRALEISKAASFLVGRCRDYVRSREQGAPRTLAKKEPLHIHRVGARQ